jgi:hypothetical protein
MPLQTGHRKSRHRRARRAGVHHGPADGRDPFPGTAVNPSSFQERIHQCDRLMLNRKFTSFRNFALVSIPYR